ncbi:MAG: hypothetical protein EPN39_00365 [Chitinophagaceae bacterium]|nr:MAG: hypothetical protein EPN39_00365 [Chitinophagaceae bacterium]
MNNNDSHLPTGQAGLYAIYANPEHVHWLASRSPGLAEETLASIVAESSERFISQNKLCIGPFACLA